MKLLRRIVPRRLTRARFSHMLSIAAAFIQLFAFASTSTVALGQEAQTDSGESAGQASAPDAEAVVEEYEALHLEPPVWPIEAARRGVEGDVVVSLTIKEDGTTDDIKVVETADERLNIGATEAAEKSTFKPRTVNGEAVAVTGVIRRYRFQFNDISLEDPRNPASDN